MTNNVQNLINAAYCCAGNSMSFTVMFNDVVGTTHKYYFHEATLEKYNVSIWSTNWHSDNPVEIVLKSKSGLTLRLIDIDRKGVYSCWVTNPHRKEIHKTYTGWRSEPQRELSYKEDSIIFLKQL